MKKGYDVAAVYPPGWMMPSLSYQFPSPRCHKCGKMNDELLDGEDGNHYCPSCVEKHDIPLFSFVDIREIQADPCRLFVCPTTKGWCIEYRRRKKEPDGDRYDVIVVALVTAASEWADGQFQEGKTYEYVIDVTKIPGGVSLQHIQQNVIRRMTPRDREWREARPHDDLLKAGFRRHDHGIVFIRWEPPVL